MNMQAVAGYLRGLREGRGLSQVQVAASVGTMLGRDVQSTTIWRIETAKTVPGGDMLLALLNTLRGDLDELLRLYGSTDATIDDGRAAALLWIQSRGAPEDVATIIRAADQPNANQLADELQALAERIRRGGG